MSERLSDVRHQDELDRMKGRLLALSVAADAMSGASDEVFSGFHQLIVDASDAMRRCAEAFDAEREMRNSAEGEAHV